MQIEDESPDILLLTFFLGADTKHFASDTFQSFEEYAVAILPHGLQMCNQSMQRTIQAVRGYSAMDTLLHNYALHSPHASASELHVGHPINLQMI